MIEERTAVHGRLDTSPAAIEKTHTKRLFQATNGRRHDGLRDGKVMSRFRHAAPLYDREQDMQIAQLEAASNPICPMHICHS